MGTFADDLQAPLEVHEGEYNQANLNLVDADERVFLGNFDELQDKAKEAGDRWIEAVSYYMAQHTGERTENANNQENAENQEVPPAEDGGTGETGGTNPTVDPAENNVSQIGLLLSTSVGLQKINMLFNVLKGIIEATAAKAVEVAQSIANAARGR